MPLEMRGAHLESPWPKNETVGDSSFAPNGIAQSRAGRPSAPGALTLIACREIHTASARKGVQFRSTSKKAFVAALAKRKRECIRQIQ